MSIDTTLAEHSSNPLVEYNPNAILVVDNMKIAYANEAAGHVFHTQVSDLTNLVFESLNQSEESLSALIQHTQQAIESKSSHRHHLSLMSGAGIRHYEATFTFSQEMVYIFFQDISSQVQTESALQSQATHDPLTGLFNRQQLFLMGAQDIARSKRYKNSVSILVVTIDNMRHINQSYGYAVGDHVLINIARSLKDILRESDYAARLDNKSFVICLIDATLAQIEIVTQRIQTAVTNRDITIADSTIPVEITYGGAELDSEIDHQFDDFLLRAEKNCTER
ncbi:GGDEF domain-containing protein [Neptunomonas sp.]|uniref:GGDEF domain-containing protein n=1 Tax=Neptunomonas sp. TaxID=1971898 RepID=UPI002601487A|nr:GGDEF domain-containing protein [Neptunomonas sp.]